MYCCAQPQHSACGLSLQPQPPGAAQRWGAHRAWRRRLWDRAVSTCSITCARLASPLHARRRKLVQNVIDGPHAPQRGWAIDTPPTHTCMMQAAADKLRTCWYTQAGFQQRCLPAITAGRRRRNACMRRRMAGNQTGHTHAINHQHRTSIGAHASQTNTRRLLDHSHPDIAAIMTYLVQRRAERPASRSALGCRPV